MSQHPLRTLIETCDAAISRRDFDALMAFYAEDAALVVKPGMVVRLSLIHISEPTRRYHTSRMPSSA